MNPRAVLSFTGLVLVVVAVILLLPLGVAIVDGQPRAIRAYALTAALTGAGAVALRLAGRGGAPALHRKDAFGVVALAWLLFGVIGALPLMLDQAVTDPVGALFEAVSGFTTTGATVIADIDGLSRATNLWRCLMHWVGGMGIVVLFVAVFPQLGVGAKQLFKAEVPGLPSEGLRPRIRETASRLWWIYAGLTALCALLLWLGGMSAYDAVCHAFSTLATGGFSTRTASAAAWDSPVIQWTLALFMLLAAVNFGLYYGLLRGVVREVLRNTELRFFLLFNAALILCVVVAIAPMRGLGEPTLREATFSVLAVTTTTGFMTADWNTYPDSARILLFMASFMGGCAGSTAGGLKAARVLMLGKVAARELRTTANPHAVIAVRLGHAVVPEAVVTGVLVFVTTYFGLFALASIVVVAGGMDLVSGTTAVVGCLSSVGPGLGTVGPAGNYAEVSALAKLMLCFCMLAGRLEVFALVAIFSPEVWRR